MHLQEQGQRRRLKERQKITLPSVIFWQIAVVAAIIWSMLSLLI
jgi:hypothetical protein